MEALSSHRLPALLGRITLALVLLVLMASLWGWGQGSEEPRGKLRLRFVDSGTGQITPVRVEVLDQENQAFVAEDALLVGGDSVDQAVRWEGSVEDALARLRPGWRNFDKGTTQFYSGGESLLQLPSGQYGVTASKGIEYREVSQEVAVASGSDSELTLEIPRWVNMPEKGWYSADPHIHVARTHKELDPLISKWMQAEDVHVATLLQWGNVTGFNNAPQYDFGPDSVYREGIYLLASGQENPRTHLFGHTITLGASEPVNFPDQYLIYRLFWEEARRQGGLSGYAHMGIQAGAQNGLSIDLPLNLISFLEVLQFNGADFNVWYSILNTGFKMSPTAGSDYPFGGAPIGRERFYTHVEGTLTYRKWLDGIERGRTFVSNGPLLEFTVNVRGLGEEVVLTQTGTVRIEGSVRFNPDRDEVEKMEVVANGQIIRSFRASEGASEIHCDFELPVEDAGWVALRASGTKLGLRKPFSSLAHTAPVYVAVQGRPSRAEHQRAKALCLAWAGRLGELESRLASQFGAMALSRWDENIAGGYVLKQREELRKAIRSAREYFLTRAGL